MYTCSCIRQDSVFCRVFAYTIFRSLLCVYMSGKTSSASEMSRLQKLDYSFGPFCTCVCEMSVSFLPMFLLGTVRLRPGGISVCVYLGLSTAYTAIGGLFNATFQLSLCFWRTLCGTPYSSCARGWWVWFNGSIGGIKGLFSCPGRLVCACDSESSSHPYTCNQANHLD